MRERFRDKNFSPEAQERITVVNRIIADYQAQDLRLTLRQLYYQLVTQNIVPNEDKQYKRLGDLLSDARLAGLVDWAAIEDRGREPWTPADWPDLKTFADTRIDSYRLPRWQGQPRYVELWVEKQALAGVLEPLASRFHVTLMVNKGYSSQSAMYESAKRYLYSCVGVDDVPCKACDDACGACRACTGDGFTEGTETSQGSECRACDGSGTCPRCKGTGVVNERRKEPWLFYLGDHDPSGEDMVRDIKDRMVMFGVDNIRVFKLALNMKQVEKYNPPPNPTKMSDSRAEKYKEKYDTDSSWEVDALPPVVLQQIITDAFNRVIDRPKMDAIIEREKSDKNKFRAAVTKIVE